MYMVTILVLTLHVIYNLIYLDCQRCLQAHVLYPDTNFPVVFATLHHRVLENDFETTSYSIIFYREKLERQES
jgi:hypothetical protein